MPANKRRKTRKVSDGERETRKKKAKKASKSGSPKKRKSGSAAKRKQPAKKKVTSGRRKAAPARKPSKSARKSAKRSQARKRVSAKPKKAASKRKTSGKSAKKTTRKSGRKRAVSRKPARKTKRKKVTSKRKKSRVTRDVSPVTRIPHPPPAPAKPTYPVGSEKKLAKNIYFVDMGDMSGFEEFDKLRKGEELTRFRTFSTGTTPNNRNFGALFEQALKDYAKKTPFEDVDDIPLYRFGVSITTRQPRRASEISSLISQYQRLMTAILPQGATSHIVDEGKYLSVTMNLGNYRLPINASDAKNYIDRNKELYDAFIGGALDISSDIAWFEFWDTEELHYE